MARPRKNPLTVEKFCPTCKKSFVVPYQKKHQTFCSRSCSNHSPLVLEKIKQGQERTYHEKYGGTHPMTHESVKEKFKATMQRLHGVDWYGQSPEHRQKVKATKKKRYGDENYTNREQAKQTCLERYGVDNICKSEEIMNRRIQARRESHYAFLKDFCEKENLIPMFSLSEYQGYHFSFCYKFACKKCSHVFESTVYNLDNLFCEKCNPNRSATLENTFFDFLTSCGAGVIKRRDRTILYGKELDFLIKDKNTAFELNGLFWHSENGGGHVKTYHLNKTKGCLFHGISLVHIFENEWRDNQEIVKSIIRNKLNDVAHLTKLHARHCSVRDISIQEKDAFLTANHLQGKDKSTIKLGLDFEGELVSVMTFRKTSRFDKTSEWEMVRFCNKLNTVICGGASKLFTHFVRTYSPESIVSYSDRRYFDGSLYSKLGFEFVRNTPPSYHYISKDYKHLMHRMQFQKHKLRSKLSNFDSSLSEWENMKQNGFDRLWDCGHSKWLWTPKEKSILQLQSANDDMKTS